MRRWLPMPHLLHIARELRQKQTPAEEVLWALLRRKNLVGLKFRRQQQLGPFIADFYCHRARLVIEVDGGIHETRTQADIDENRDFFLREHRLRVLRFTNQQILEDPESVLRQIAWTAGNWDETVPAVSEPS
ncbi:MAG: endonuclease domain-containing protein [Actinomycetia bacterium]|nr:endonuclease domain-containing protein [Actinomycetes bacterium]